MLVKEGFQANIHILTPHPNIVEAGGFASGRRFFLRRTTNRGLIHPLGIEWRVKINQIHRAAVHAVHHIQIVADIEFV